MIPAILLAVVGAAAPPRAACLVEAYPEQLCGATATELRWCDGTRMAWRDGPAPRTHDERLRTGQLLDMVGQRYPLGRPPASWAPPLDHDPGRIRHAPFFARMYGATKAAVRARTAKVRWLDGKVLRVTTVNDVHRRLERVRDALAALPADVRPVARQTSGAFLWRRIKGTDRLSAHSHGIAIDVGVPRSDYWRWQPEGKRRYRNRIPWQIVEAFEREGFIWGGKWHHFDTMHFEYRPELHHPACSAARAFEGDAPPPPSGE